jgi:uncharacterized protein (DUF2236 family)
MATPGGPVALAPLRRRLGEQLFLRVAGPDGPRHRERIHGTPGPRWFDPASPIGRVHGDASMFVGGIRAVLLQTMHPAAMRAVAEHSGYRGDMWGRLARTSRFLAVTTFGTARHAEQAVAAVRGIHETVTGTMPDGTPYAASDPHLLSWVHVAEVDSFLRAHQAYCHRPLDRAGRDEYVAQAGEVARRLGVVDPPTTEAAVAAELASFAPELRATEEAREAVRWLMLHPDLPLAARPAYGVLFATAASMLPPWVRAELGLPRLTVSGRTVVPPLGRAATRTIRWALASAP